MLTVPEITEGEVSAIEKGIEEKVKTVKGSVISFEKWGRCRLAYPVKHNDYGVYFLTRFESDADQKFLVELKTFFTIKFDDIIMRSVMHRLDPKKGLEYRRPETVDEIPTRDVDSFLRENKMEGLIAKTPSEKSSETVVATSVEKTEAAPAAALESLQTLDAVDSKGSEKEAVEVKTDEKGE